MSARGSPIGFGIFDLLTRVIPGAVFLLMAFGPTGFITFGLSIQNLTSYLIVFTVLSLLTGETINHISWHVYSPPASFKRFLHEQGLDVSLGLIDRIRQALPFLLIRSNIHTNAKDDFWHLFRTQFRFEEEYHNASDIYHHLLTYMEPRLSPRTLRQMTVFHFVNNTAIAVLFGGIAVILSVLFEWFSGALTGSILSLSIIGYGSGLAVLYVLAAIFGYQESIYVSYLLIEYYIDRVEAGDVEEETSKPIQTKLDEIT